MRSLLTLRLNINRWFITFYLHDKSLVAKWFVVTSCYRAWVPCWSKPLPRQSFCEKLNWSTKMWNCWMFGDLKLPVVWTWGEMFVCLTINSTTDCRAVQDVILSFTVWQLDSLQPPLKCISSLKNKWMDICVGKEMKLPYYIGQWEKFKAGWRMGTNFTVLHSLYDCSIK